MTAELEATTTRDWIAERHRNAFSFYFRTSSQASKASDELIEKMRWLAVTALLNAPISFAYYNVDAPALAIVLSLPTLVSAITTIETLKKLASLIDLQKVAESKHLRFSAIYKRIEQENAW